MAMIFNDGATTCAFTVANAGEVVYRLKTLMKAAGWVHQASSDGTNVSNTAGNANDQITSAAEMNTNHAWIVLAKNNRQLIFRRGTSESVWLVAYVPPTAAGAQQTATVAGTTTAVPQFTTRHALIGTLPDTTASWFSGAASSRWTCGADSDADNCNLYLAGWGSSGTTSAGGALFIDQLAEDSVHATDVDPVIIYAASGGSSPWLDNSLASDTIGPMGWYRRGLTGEGFYNYSSAHFASYQGSATTVDQLGDGLGINPWDPDKVLVAPMIYFRRESTSATAVSAVGVKGKGTLWYWRGGYHLTGKLFTKDVANDRIVIGDAILPWDPTQTPPLWS